MSWADRKGQASILLGFSALLLVGFDLWLASYAPLDVPYLRELYFAGVASGREPISWELIHRPTLEHVMPLPMALGAYAIVVSGIAGVNRVLNVVVLALASLLVTRAAARIRGHSELSDVVVVLILLGPAHVFSFVSGFNLQLVLSGALFATGIAAAWVLVRRPNRAWLATGLCVLLLMPLCGVSGVLSAVFAWLAVGVASWRMELSRPERGGVVVCLLTSALFALRYFPWSQLGQTHQHVVDPLRLAAELLPASLGAIGSQAWPASLLVVALALVSALVLLVSSRERAALSVFALGVAAQLVIALAIGYGRAHYDNALAFTERYVELAAPTLILVHLGLASAARSNARRARRFGLAFAVVLFAASALNAPIAVRRVQEAARGLSAFARDARSGTSQSQLAAAHGDFLYPFDRGVLLAGMSTLMLERRPPFDVGPRPGFVSSESSELPCRSDSVHWLRPTARTSPSDFAFAPERALDGFVASEWRARDAGESVLEVELRDAGALVFVCVMPGSRSGPERRVRVEAWADGRHVGQAVGDLQAGSEFSLLNLSAPRVERLRVIVPAGGSIAELRFAP